MKLGRLLKLIVLLLVVLVVVKVLPPLLGPYWDTFYNPDSVLIEKKKENIKARNNKEERDWIGDSLDMGKKLDEAKAKRYDEPEYVPPEDDEYDEY
ncbi:MAG: hypothetical protein D6B28_09625 [Gammaproteobacteria bacterium]|nr:MAG: hypothetical protein D6B28_09625 [Gammaproteobacteria bacterium]